MIGIIAGELIGSPYTKENLKNVSDIFFPLFEPQVVINPKNYKEKIYKPSLGRLSYVALNFDDISDLSYINGNSLPEMICGAIVFGRICAAGHMDSKQAEHMAEIYISWFEDEYSQTLVDAFYAAYRLKGGLGKGIPEMLGTIRVVPVGAKSVPEPLGPQILSALLKGELVEDRDGTYIPSDGKYDDSHILDAAFYAVEHSSSFEEAVRRATALGGNSAALAAITGGLAELAFGVPEYIEYKARNELDNNQNALLKRFETMEGLFAEHEEIAKKKNEENLQSFTIISVLSLPGKTKVYSVPAGRQDIINSIKKVNKDSIFVDSIGMQKLYERVLERRSADGEILSGTFIDVAVPEVRKVYYLHKDRKLYSPSSLPVKNIAGFRPLEERMKTKNEFLQFIAKVEAIRDIQEKRIGHNPTEGHIHFSSAWWIEIGKDRVRLMKGETPYGEFGLDEKGRMRVNGNIIGGTYSGEYLQASLDNQRVFYNNDNVTQVLEKISEKCLDDGFVPDPARPVPMNIELMYQDLSHEPIQLRKAADVSDEVLKERTSKTRTRSDYGISSVPMTIDEAIYSKAHQGAVFTIGHSNLSIGEFIRNCRRNGITMVRDIRSWPYSKSFPQFNQKELQASLEAEGIKYVFNGDAMGGHIRRSGLPDNADGIIFTMSEGGYAQRTRENAMSADLTLAFADDFTTAGEKVTEKAAAGNYIAIPLDDAIRDAGRVAKEILDCMTEQEKSKPITLNIAGNGMYTLSSFNRTQKQVNDIVYDVLTNLQSEGVTIGKVISGGQSGVDEAGIVAAHSMGISCEVHAPKGWLMRGEDGRDIFSECEFKNRFMDNKFTKELSYQEMMTTTAFREVYDSIIADARSGERQALMCAETSPTDCHRFACVGYALEHPKEAGRKFASTEVHHIKRDGQTIPQTALEKKLCRDARVEYNDSNLASVMRKACERIQHPNPNDRPIRLSSRKAHKVRV